MRKRVKNTVFFRNLSVDSSADASADAPAIINISKFSFIMLIFYVSFSMIRLNKLLVTKRTYSFEIISFFLHKIMKFLHSFGFVFVPRLLAESTAIVVL